MRIGNLNSKVMIQKSEIVKDRIGNRTNSWVDYFQCSAVISHEKGDETYAAGTENDHSDMNVTVRYCSETKAVKKGEYRLVFDGDLFEIEAVDHHGFKRKQITFVCKKINR